MTTPAPTSMVRIVPRAAGRWYSAFGDEVTVLLGAAETGGRYTMFLGMTQPGGGPPPHTHENEDEWFFVLDGRAEFFDGVAWTAAPPGTSVFVPRGSLHTFRNTGDSPLRMLIHTSPCGFEEFFSRCHQEFARPGEPDMSCIMRIACEHGIRFA